jgi:hypothetical protein
MDRPRALTIGPIGVVEAAALLAQTGALIRLRTATWEGHDVTDIRVTQQVDSYETTMMGTAAPTYAAGLTRTEVEIDLLYDKDHGVPAVGSDMLIDQTFGVWRIRGHVLLTAVVVNAHAGSLMRMSVRALGTGPFTIEHAEPEQHEEAIRPGRRAVAFGGLGEG